MNQANKLTDLEQTEEAFHFLQGNIPEGYKIREDRIPKLTADQAWTALWYFQELYWQPNGEIERCDVCGQLYDSVREGDCQDFGDAPYHFCDNCLGSEEYEKKFGGGDGGDPDRTGGE